VTLVVRLRHAFGDFALDLGFEAPAGVTALHGPSGAGKTSVVRAVAGLLHPDQGRIALNGTVLFDSAARIRVPPHRRRIGAVFQEPRLFPHLSVRRNLTYGRRMAGAPRDAAAFDRVTELLGLGGLLDRRPGGLSGGEAQRVAIGRALLARPRLLVMDEPLSALDAPRRAEILPYLARLRDEAGVPILYVSHSAAEVAQLATTIVLMEAGRVRRAGPAADILADPAVAPSLGTGGAGAVLSGRVAAHHADGLSEIALDRVGVDGSGPTTPGKGRPEQRIGEERPGQERLGKESPGKERPAERRPEEQRPGEQRPGEQRGRDRRTRAEPQSGERETGPRGPDARPAVALFVPLVSAPPGAAVRVRIAAEDVMLALDAPARVSALNVLPGRVSEIGPQGGPSRLVQVETGGGRLLARITQRSAEALALAPGKQVFAVVKTVSVARSGV
jgi:molybdenum ABC transporter ATP-binding protein